MSNSGEIITQKATKKVTGRFQKRSLNLHRRSLGPPNRKESIYTGVRGLVGSVNVRKQNQKGKVKPATKDGVWRADEDYFGSLTIRRDLAAAHRFAGELIRKLSREGKLSEEAKSKEGQQVLQEVVTIVIARQSGDAKQHVYSTAERLKAAAISLPFLMPKPESATKVTVQTAEDFLLGVSGASAE